MCVEEMHVNRYDAPHHYGYHDVGYRGSQVCPPTHASSDAKEWRFFSSS